MVSNKGRHLVILEDDTHKSLWLYKVEHRHSSLNNTVKGLLLTQKPRKVTKEVVDEWKKEYSAGSSYQNIADKWAEELGYPINKMFVQRKVVDKKSDKVVERAMYLMWVKEHETDSYAIIADRWSESLGVDINSKYVERKIKELEKQL